MRNFLMIALCCTALVLGGCASKVQYGDPTAVETVDEKFGSTDLQQIAAKMVDSMLTFPTVMQMTATQQPVLYVEGVKNKTREHIDLEAVTDTIVNKLLRSAKFRFVDKATRDLARQELGFQNNSGMVDPNTAARIGRHIGAQYMLHGNISNITKQSASTKDVYYKFTLKMINLETGILTWQDEKEIRKSIKRSWFGL